MTAIAQSVGFSRRSLLHGGALAGMGLAFGGTAFSPLFGQAKPASWPHVHQLELDYVSAGKVANMVAYFGLGESAPVLLAEGRDTMGGKRKSDADSLYRMYSMTKPITGMGAMILIGEGKMGLDQPLHEILPKFAKMQVQKQYDGSIGPENLEPAVRPITIRHLLTHTAGLGYTIVQQGPLKDAYEKAGLTPGRFSRVPVPGLFRGETVRSLELFADRLAEMPLIYQPGTHWSYSVALDLMGRVIEVVSGKPFDAFLKERIFGPCGMTSSWFRVPDKELYRLTTNYISVNGSLIPIDPPNGSVFSDEPPFPFGGAGLVSSPRDYDRFLKMVAGYGMIEGTRVIPEEAVQIVTSNLLPSPDVVKGSLVEGHGFGAGGQVGWKGAPRAYGWAGAASTIGITDMESGLRVGLYTQYSGTPGPLYADSLEAIGKDVALQKGIR